MPDIVKSTAVGRFIQAEYGAVGGVVGALILQAMAPS